MSDPYQAAQRAAEEHLAACNEVLWWEEAGPPDQPSPTESPAFGPYCGCDTCVVREVLHAAVPFMAAIAEAEKAA